MKRILVILFLGSCMVTPCRAQDKRIEKIFAYSMHHEIYPGIVFGKTFGHNAFKIGVNLMDYAEINSHIKVLHSDSSFWHYKEGYPFGEFLIPGISLNHHFGTNNSQNAISQSLDLFFYIPLYRWNEVPLLAIGANTRHYDLKTFTISPQIKLLPPFLNLYLQKNYHISGKESYNIQKYEFGIELNLNSVVWLFNQDFGVPGGWASYDDKEDEVKQSDTKCFH